MRVGPVTSDPAVIDGRFGSPVTGRSGPSWLALRVQPDSVVAGRRFVATRIEEYATDLDHAHSIVLITSELVTNAYKAAEGLVADGLANPWTIYDKPIRLGISATARWAHLRVTDPDPRPLRFPSENDPLAEAGRGLLITEALSAWRWITYTHEDKTLHAVVAAPGVELTAAEMDEAG